MVEGDQGKTDTLHSTLSLVPLPDFLQAGFLSGGLFSVINPGSVLGHGQAYVAHYRAESGMRGPNLSRFLPCAGGCLKFHRETPLSWSRLK